MVTQCCQRAPRDLTQRNPRKAPTFSKKNFAKTNHNRKEKGSCLYTCYLWSFGYNAARTTGLTVASMGICFSPCARETMTPLWGWETLQGQDLVALFFHPVVVGLTKILLGERGCLSQVCLCQVSQDSLAILSHNQCGPAIEPTTINCGWNNFRPAGAWPVFWRQESHFLVSYLNEQWLWSPETVTLV